MDNMQAESQKSLNVKSVMDPILLKFSAATARELSFKEFIKSMHVCSVAECLKYKWQIEGKAELGMQWNGAMPHKYHC